MPSRSRSGAGDARVSRGAVSRGVTLQSAGARVQAMVEPRAGCVMVSMRVDGHEWLRLPEPLADFLEHDRTGGVPLLFPWSNRLRGDRFQVLGQRVDLRRVPRVHRDGSGRPMHGVLLRWSQWQREQSILPSDFRATLDWHAHRQLFRAFPFAFTLRLIYRAFESGANSAGVEIETEIESRDTPVPLSFGWHPYLALPAPRAKCRLQTPAMARVTLRDGLPLRSGGSLQLSAPVPLSGALPRGGLDDLFAGVVDGTTISVVGGLRQDRRISVEFVRGYRFAQLYTPPDADFICIEPMMAPTAALSDAASELPILAPNRRASSLFRIVVSRA